MPVLDFAFAYQDWGLTFLRVAIGIVFVVHGMPKLFGPQPGIAGFTAWLRSMGVPFAGFFGLIVPLVEFFGGLALIVGFLVPLVAIPLAINMVVASVLKVKKMGKKFSGDGGWELDFVILAGTVVLALYGAGAFGLDLWLS